MTRSQGLIALEGVEGDEAERLLSAVRRSPAALHPDLEARIREFTKREGISVSYEYTSRGAVRRGSRTRGHPVKYPWEW